MSCCDRVGHELTSGTTWHSAAQVTNFGMYQTMVRPKSHSIALYKKLRNDHHDPVGYRHDDSGTGGYRVNEVAAMMGVQHTVASMGHQYPVTDDILAIADRTPHAAAALSDRRLLLTTEKERPARRFLRAGLPDVGPLRDQPRFLERPVPRRSGPCLERA